MLIWGSRGREIAQGWRQFNCPQCDVPQPIQARAGGHYFTLVLHSLIRDAAHGDYIECQRCLGKYEQAVLAIRLPKRKENACVFSILAD